MYLPYFFQQYYKLLIKLMGVKIFQWSKNIFQMHYSRFCINLLHTKTTFLVPFHLTYLLLNSCDMWFLRLFCGAKHKLIYGKKYVLFCEQCKNIKHQDILHIKVQDNDEICTSRQFHGFLQWAISEKTHKVDLNFTRRRCYGGLTWTKIKFT